MKLLAAGLGLAICMGTCVVSAERPGAMAWPDPLVMTTGRLVTNAAQWHAERRPELATLVQRHEYGMLPAPVPVAAVIERNDDGAMGGAATIREVRLDLARPDDARIHLMVILPNRSARPVPVLLGLNFRGNHALLDDPGVNVQPVFESECGCSGGELRGKDRESWDVEACLARGYALATFWNGDVVPDDAVRAEGRLRALAGRSDPERGPADCGAIAAWAWCLQRAVDYLVTVPEIDARRIGVVGHSRNGKAALVAAAFDPRIALVIPAQAGCGGTAPCRVPADLAKPGPDGRPSVETIASITSRFPHWFARNFSTAGANPERLPFDQHAVVALCAPRPVLFSCATSDRWSNPEGQFEVLRGADPVYRLVAGEGLSTSRPPETGHLSPGRLGYFIRHGSHSVTREDWAAWLDYADRWMPAR
jgi:hypothetical protein